MPKPKHRKHQNLYLAVFFLAAALAWNPLLAQPVMRTNEKGETIIVFPDGTTQLFSEFGNAHQPEPAQSGEKPADNKYPVLDVKIEPLEGGIPVTSEDLRRISERKAQLSKTAASIAQERAEEATRQRNLLEEDYRQAISNNASPEALERLSARLKAARQTETETNSEAKLALREANRAEELTRRGNYVEEYQRNQLIKKNQARQYANLNLASADSYGNLLLDDNYLPFTQTDEVILHPPAPACEFAYEGKDDRGRFRRDLHKELLFTHTDERLRPFLKDKHYLTCEGYFTQLGGFRYLTLQFTFAYPNAREAYGFIEKGSYLMVKLLNGQFITLFSGKLDKGAFDTETGLLTYLVHYPIDQSQINLLKRSEADSVLVAWSSGYEEYEIYEVGFFLNQIRCLE
ncbi:MAG: efflux RND transporter periplasmic adaptor subunit [Phaeodactylibacter sp.]|nr:efflux RND transporter periplasmic adaptor subunit [Phaeodactylibacter sp.]MCB9300965.1 efflux RND transporter periplasmic adaptor subunit [Lewinellaceae bacterium]